jgi:hypothetical protein
MDDQHQSDIQQLRDEITRLLAQVANMDAALASRDIIGQAKGIIMMTKHCDADTAFELLVAQSQAEHRKLAEVAGEIVAHVSRRGGPLTCRADSRLQSSARPDGVGQLGEPLRQHDEAGQRADVTVRHVGPVVGGLLSSRWTF